MPGVCGDQRVMLDPLELELQVFVGHPVDLESNVDLEEQPVLLITMQSLQLPLTPHTHLLVVLRHGLTVILAILELPV